MESKSDFRVENTAQNYTGPAWGKCTIVRRLSMDRVFGFVVCFGKTHDRVFYFIFVSKCRF